MRALRVRLCPLSGFVPKKLGRRTRRPGAIMRTFRRFPSWRWGALGHGPRYRRPVRGGAVRHALRSQQFFPSSDRPELLVDLQLPEGASTARSPSRSADSSESDPDVDHWSTYVGQGINNLPASQCSTPG
jgi:hypothetical protein